MDFIYYTDGACTLNQKNGVYFPGPGGAAAIKVAKEECVWKNVVSDKHTTNNIMELTAIKLALEDFQRWSLPGDKAVIHSDSSYCINIYTSWIKGWEKRGWRRAGDRPIENLKLIKEIYDMINSMQNENFCTIEFVKVKGHSTDKYNNIVDKLAVDAKKKATED